MSNDLSINFDIAILIPCYNEAITISEVVRGFKESLPSAQVYVYDNNSSDSTALRAMLSGAKVVRESHQGKGNVVRRMFSDIDADIYLIADGDGTYSTADAPQLVNNLITERADMVVGVRRYKKNYIDRKGHLLGNLFFNKLYRIMFRDEFTDIFSGYRAFSRRFVKSFPAISSGFEIETEMSVYSSLLKIPVVEIELDYGSRPEGSSSKLSTFTDGIKILSMFILLLKETRPFMFFGLISIVLMLISLCLMNDVLIDYNYKGFVSHNLTFWVSLIAAVSAYTTLMMGLVLHSIARLRLEQLRMQYMTFSAINVSQKIRKGLLVNVA
ncbi:Glycosyltransferase [Liberibacter crescens BT-1]|uniref:Glycosyltransferase n=1 Tax=Liberibacter crescens (strain BT-1) TaxID=1215343 RepID=L0ERC8_LIBCB|nr:glycosyltransferase [Liberibacter crescens]AGA64019.1 Glycosyltransferase [Liberibacter crescens BT-1]